MAAAAAGVKESGEGAGGSEQQRVRVAVRVRPFVDHADRSDSGAVVLATPQSRLIAVDRGSSSKEFAFDAVFGPEASQEDVFAHIGDPMLRDVMEGFHATCFAYGQTGSGKTFSMMGGKGSEGLIPRIALGLFSTLAARAEQAPGVRSTISMTFVEIYNECIFDLLVPRGSEGHAGKPPALALREIPKQKTWRIEGLTEVPVSSARDIARLISQGNKLRHSALTGMNTASSRSHAIVTLVVDQQHEPPSPAFQNRCANLTLIDLAGSECLSKTGNEGERAAEATHINKSLLTLCNCLRSASDPTAPLVPVRDSLLTKVLAPVFGGNARTFMLACVSPAPFNLTESQATLQMAFDSKKIKNRARANLESRSSPADALLQEHARLLQASIDQAEQHITQRRELKAAIAAAKHERDEAHLTLQQESVLPDRQIASMRAEIAALRASNDALRERVREWTARVNEREAQLAERKARRAEFSSRIHSDSDPFLPPFPDDVGQPLGSDHDDTIHDGLAQTHSASVVGLSTIRNDPSASRSVDTGSTPTVFVGAQATLYACQFSSDGNRVITGCATGRLRIYDRSLTPKNFEAFDHKKAISGICVLSDGEHFVTVGRDGRIMLYTGLRSGSYSLIRKGKVKADILCCSAHPRDLRFVVCRSDGVLSVFECRDRQLRETVALSSNGGDIFSVVVTQDGKSAITGGRDGTIRVWGLENRVMQTRKIHQVRVWSVDLTLDGRYALSGADDGSFAVTSVLEASRPIRHQIGHAGAIMSVHWVANGRQFLTASKDSFIKLWSLASDTCLAVLAGHGGTIFSISVSGQSVASVSADKTLRVWSVSDIG